MPPLALRTTDPPLVAFFLLRVHVPVIWPVVAYPGELIAVCPTLPDRRLIVLSADGRQVRRWDTLELGALWGPLLILQCDEVLTCLSPAQMLAVLDQTFRAAA